MSPETGAGPAAVHCGGAAEAQPLGIIQDLEVTFFVACYNEQLHIRDTLETTAAAAREVGCTYEIIVIDDASRDRSVEIVKSYMAEHPDCPIRLICREKNRGLAYNFVDAAFEGRGRYYHVVHGDNPEPKETMVRLLRERGKARVIIAYQKQVDNRSLFRRFLSRTYTHLVNFATGIKLRYWNGPGLVTRYDVMRWHSYHTGFSFHAEFLSNMLLEGYSYLEFGGVYKEQGGRKSHAITLRNWLSVAHCLTTLFLRRVGRRLIP